MSRCVTKFEAENAGYREAYLTYFGASLQHYACAPDCPCHVYRYFTTNLASETFDDDLLVATCAVCDRPRSFTRWQLHPVRLIEAARRKFLHRGN